NFGGTGKDWSHADSNYDGVVDTVDFNMLASNFGKQLADPSSSVGAVVPEPASLGLLALAGMAGIGACRRRRRVRAARAMSLAAVLAVPAVASAGTVVNFFEADNFAQGPPDYNDLAYVGQGAFSDPGNNHWNGFAPPGFGTPNPYHADQNGNNTTSTGASSAVTLSLSTPVDSNGGIWIAPGPDGT